MENLAVGGKSERSKAEVEWARRAGGGVARQLQEKHLWGALIQWTRIGRGGR